MDLFSFAEQPEQQEPCRCPTPPPTWERYFDGPNMKCKACQGHLATVPSAGTEQARKYQAILQKGQQP